MNFLLLLKKRAKIYFLQIPILLKKHKNAQLKKKAKKSDVCDKKNCTFTALK